MIIALASNNIHKKKELSAILDGHTVLAPGDLDIGEFDPDETGTSFAENALLKARALSRELSERVFPGRFGDEGVCVLADDSGLCVDALDGRPGIYSARYRGTIPPETAAKEKLSDGERNALLIEELNAALAGHPSVQSRNACFVCAMALLFCGNPLRRFYLVQETLEGEITASALGEGGFGYDPIMYLPELGRTVAELSETEKNRLSHRGKAAKAIVRLLGG